jgi:hypothetical protein
LEFWSAIFILFWVIGSFVAEGFLAANLSIDKGWDFVSTPKVIYRNSRMNIFGCSILWLLLRAASPLATIWLFVYWAFHVGRKDEKPKSKDSF